MRMKTFTCNKCGKQVTYNEDWKQENDFKSMEEKNQCWNINLGWAEYGSELDTCEIKFNLCDKCLAQLIESLNNKQEIYNSSDTYWSQFKTSI